jgi:hypothetical protein
MLLCGSFSQCNVCPVGGALQDYTYFKLDHNLTGADPDAQIAMFNMPLL